MTLTEQLAAEYAIDAWPEPRRAAAYQHLAEMEEEIDLFPFDEAEIVGDTRAALSALRDTKDVWL
jgi:hypothetical protein